MKKLIIALLLTLPLTLSAQKYNWKRPLLAGSISFVSGAAWGLHEVTAHHYESRFQPRFPKANPRYWNPDISWLNKYEGGIYENGRAKIGPFNKPVVLTDAKHLLASINQVGMLGAGAVITFGEKRPIWHYAVDAAISFGFYSLGNHITYKGIYLRH